MDYKARHFINELTEEIIKEYDLPTPITNLEQVVTRIGGRIVRDASIPVFLDGKIRKIKETGSAVKQFEIVIPEVESPRRVNFTIAHELGHLFLHMGYEIDPNRWNAVGDIEYFRKGNSEEEYQANEFAAALLMPKTAFTSKIEENCNEDNTVNMQPVADYFGVSVEAATTRGKWLGVLEW